jgi:predicted MPP superfamily phosphohydrolase
MNAAETIRILLFLGVVVFIFVRAIAATYRCVRGRPISWREITFMALAVIGVVCVAYGYFIEPNWLEITHVEVPTSKLPAGTRPIRIVHISDVHSDPRPRLEEKLARVIELERPAAIVFTGDSINSPSGLPIFTAMLKRLVSVAPTFVVRGNWDVLFWGDIPLFQGTGVHELDGTAERLDVQGVSIWIAGLAYGNEANLRQTLRPIPAEKFTLLLYHTPDLIEDVAREPVDLYCAGHTHGGQVALPLYGALLTLSRFDKKYEAGFYREKDTALYVNRGIGMEGGGAPRVRFWSRPEVTVIDIVAQPAPR